VTAIIAAFVGIVSALLTNFLAPSLQYYFWARQRQAERQFAVIDEVSKFGAELLFLLQRAKDGQLDISDREERLYITLHTTAVVTQVLFSTAGAEEFQRFLRTFDGMRVSPEHQDPQQVARILQAHSNLLITLYKEVGIPAPSLPNYVHENFLPLLQRGWTSTQEAVTRRLARRK
jgi:hypothetical protein